MPEKISLNDRIIKPLFLAKNSKPCLIRKEVAQKYKIEENFLYQINLVTFLSDNLINCLLILASTNEDKPVSDTFSIFDLSERDKARDFCWAIFRLFHKEHFDFLEFDGRMMSENDYLSQAALWIKGERIENI